jgi:hypothetical protein
MNLYTPTRIGVDLYTEKGRADDEEEKQQRPD